MYIGGSADRDPYAAAGDGALGAAGVVGRGALARSAGPRAVRARRVGQRGGEAVRGLGPRGAAAAGRPAGAGAAPMAFCLLMAIFAAVGSLSAVPKWLILRELHPCRNSFVQGVDIEAASWDAGFGCQHPFSPTAKPLPWPAVDTEVRTELLPSLCALRFVAPNSSLCDLRIGLAMDWERVQQLVPAHRALHAGMILFHPHADGPDRQVTDACRHPPEKNGENMRPCCVPEGCGSALDPKRRGTPVRAQALLRRVQAAPCREGPARYPERSF